MLKRRLQTIQLTLADLKEYEAVRRRLRQKAAVEAAGRALSTTTVTATETAPSTTSESSSETEATQRQLKERANMPGWTQATIPDSNTNSGSTEDDTSVQAVVDESDTIAELSDDGWEDIEEEEGAVGGQL